MLNLRFFTVDKKPSDLSTADVALACLCSVKDYTPENIKQALDIYLDDLLPYLSIDAVSKKSHARLKPQRLD